MHLRVPELGHFAMPLVQEGLPGHEEQVGTPPLLEEEDELLELEDELLELEDDEELLEEEDKEVLDSHLP